MPLYRIPYFDSMVRSLLDREGSTLVTARDSGTGEMLGLALFVMERFELPK